MKLPICIPRVKSTVAFLHLLIQKFFYIGFIKSFIKGLTPFSAMENLLALFMVTKRDFATFCNILLVFIIILACLNDSGHIACISQQIWKWLIVYLPIKLLELYSYLSQITSTDSLLKDAAKIVDRWYGQHQFAQR